MQRHLQVPGVDVSFQRGVMVEAETLKDSSWFDWERSV